MRKGAFKFRGSPDSSLASRNLQDDALTQKCMRMHDRMWLIKRFLDWTSAGHQKAGQFKRCSLRRRYSFMRSAKGLRGTKRKVLTSSWRD